MTFEQQILRSTQTTLTCVAHGGETGGTGTRHPTAEDELTSVKAELEANQRAPDPEASNYRHKYGVFERVDFCHYPSAVSVSRHFFANMYYISVIEDHSVIGRSARFEGRS